MRRAPSGVPTPTTWARITCMYLKTPSSPSGLPVSTKKSIACGVWLMCFFLASYSGKICLNFPVDREQLLHRHIRGHADLEVKRRPAEGRCRERRRFCCDRELALRIMLAQPRFNKPLLCFQIGDRLRCLCKGQN